MYIHMIFSSCTPAAWLRLGFGGATYESSPLWDGAPRFHARPGNRPSRQMNDEFTRGVVVGKCNPTQFVIGIISKAMK